MLTRTNVCVCISIYIYTGIVHTLAALAGCKPISQGGILVISVQGAPVRQLITK